MALWQETSTADYRDLVTQIVAAATSEHVSAIAINAGGTGYVVGEVLTVPHAGGYLSATAEVLTEAAGVITSIALRNRGAYGDRAVSATVSAGGSGYAVGDVLEVQGGSPTERAKFKVATLSGSAVATVTLFETGGDYDSAPSNPASTESIGPNGSSGTGCTLTVTYSGKVGTSGIATTSSGSGTGATVNLTLTETGWEAVRNHNDYSVNGVLDEKEVILEALLSGWDHPFAGFRTFTATVASQTRRNVLCAGMTAHNPSTSFESQPNVGPVATPSNTSGAYIPTLNASNAAWLRITDRQITAIQRAQGASVTAYLPAYVGFGNQLGTQIENPWPFYVLANCGDQRTAPDAATDGVSGLPECARLSGATGPCWFRRISDGTWTEIVNRISSTAQVTSTLYPCGAGSLINSSADPRYLVDDGPLSFVAGGICRGDGTAATTLLFPTPDSGGDKALLVPMTHVSTPITSSNDANTTPRAELDGLYWISATKSDGSSILVEDYFEIGSDRYRVFAVAHRREAYSFFVVKEG